jgi:tRNA pseudouridine55 synthase
VNLPTTRCDGVLIIDKPRGLTSHDAVTRVRRALGERRIGHTGTLDPMATGVLPLVIGRATRLARFLSPGRKEYVAEICLGVATDTYDAEGRPATDPIPVPPVGSPALDTMLDRFRGTYLQTPPAFSAKKIGGVRAHTLARRRRTVTPAPVQVTVDRLDLLDLEGNRLRVRIVCSAGFYVRSLAHDVGIAVGCGAHLTALRRLGSGEFAIADAVPLDAVERDAHHVAEWMVPLDQLLGWVPAVYLTSAGTERAAHGSPLTPSHLLPGSGAPDWGDPQHVRLLDGRGRLLAVAEARPGVLHPIVVLV